MNIKKNKIALVLGAIVFLAAPVSSTFAHEKHCQIEDTELGDTMKYMKSELRAYVKGFKADDSEKMQQHVNELLTLSTLAAEQTPIKIKKMHPESMIDHTNIDQGDMAIPVTDHANMDHGDMAMPVVDHANMDHGDMNSAEHDMSAMPSMAGMTAEQHHQHMMYMQGMTKLNDLFKQLSKTQDKDEIKMVLGKIKEHSKKSHQLYRQDCS